MSLCSINLDMYSVNITSMLLTTAYFQYHADQDGTWLIEGKAGSIIGHSYRLMCLHLPAVSLCR